MIMRSTFFSFLCLICFTMAVRAQNNTSPYSIIGIGDLEKSSFDRTSGMGHAGLALSSNRFLYQANPASFSALDEHFFYVEVATRFQAVGYSGLPITDPTQSQSTDIQFKKIVLAIKPKPRWALSFGLLPYSTANYSFFSKKSLQGSNITTSAYYQGSGSTNQFYIANSYKVSKNFSVGLQASYLFGQLQETEELSQDVTDSALVTNRNIYVGNIVFKLGAQYKAKISKDWGVAIGATAANRTRLRADYSLLVKDGNTTLLNNEYYKSNYFVVPANYTGGIAAIYKNAYTFAVDYNYQGWSDINYKGINYSLVNSQRFSGGMEYSKKLTYLNQSYEKYFLQTGFFYSNSYLKIAGQQLNEYGVTFGAGGMIARTNSGDFGLQGALEVGERGTTTNGLIKEKYTQFNLTISYRDFWISRKMKKYD